MPSACGIAERIRPGQRREPVMAAWGSTATSQRVPLHLMAGSKEDADTVPAFPRHARPGAGRSAARRLRWRAGRDQGDRNPPPPLGAPTRPRATSCAPSPRGPRMSGRGSRPASRLSTRPQPGDRLRACQGRRRRPRRRAPLRHHLPHGRPRSLHRTPAHARHPLPGHSNHEPPRSAVRRRAPPDEGCVGSRGRIGGYGPARPPRPSASARSSSSCSAPRPAPPSAGVRSASPSSSAVRSTLSERTSTPNTRRRTQPQSPPNGRPPSRRSPAVPGLDRSWRR